MVIKPWLRLIPWDHGPDTGILGRSPAISEENVADEDNEKQPDEQNEKRPRGKPGLSDRLELTAKRALEDAERRKRLAGSSGPASDVRRIDPKDYVPAPSSKPNKTRIKPPR
jgi:hypothetical protein